MQILGTILNIFFIIVCLLLILLILMQSGRSSGMGLFGGSGSQSAFGAGSADVLTKMTAVLVALFMLTGIGMAFIKSKETSTKKIQEKFTEPAMEEGQAPEKTGEGVQKTPDSQNVQGANTDTVPGQTKQETPVQKPAQ